MITDLIGVSFVTLWNNTLPEQTIELLHSPELVQNVNAVLLFQLRGSTAYPELHVTRTVVE